MYFDVSLNKIIDELILCNRDLTPIKVIGKLVALQYSLVPMQFSGERHDYGSRNQTPRRPRFVFQLP